MGLEINAKHKKADLKSIKPLKRIAALAVGGVIAVYYQTGSRATNEQYYAHKPVATGLQHVFLGIPCIFMRIVYNCIQLPEVESEADPDGSGAIHRRTPENQGCKQL